MSALPDGAHDVMVLDARAEGQGGDRVVHLALTLMAGPHKGEVVEVAARGLEGDELDLLGTPAVLHVTDGRPRLSFG